MGLVLALALVFTACKDQPKKDAAEPAQTEVQKTLKVDPSSVKVEWTAYKFTEKTPVKGEFTKVDIGKTNEGSTWKEVLKNAEFRISALDFTTGDDNRDETIADNFFKKMDETGRISGIFLEEGKDWIINLRMNGIGYSVPAKVNFADNLLTLETVVHLPNFNALEALASLHEACGDLHTGADGISKTWDEVAVKAEVKFIEE